MASAPDAQWDSTRNEPSDYFSGSSGLDAAAALAKGDFAPFDSEATACQLWAEAALVLSAENDQLRLRVGDLEQQVSRVLSQLAEHDSAVLLLCCSSDTTTTARDELGASLARLQRLERQCLDALSASADSEEIRSSSGLAALRLALAQAKRERDEARAALSQARAELEPICAEYDDLAAELERMRMSHAEAEQAARITATRHQQQLADAAAQLAEAEGARAGLIEAKREREAQVKRLMELVRKLEAERSESNAREAEAAERRDWLELELGRMAERLARVEGGATSPHFA